MKKTIDLHRQRIPLRLLVLDAAGAVLVAGGVLDLLDTGPQLVPETWQFPGVGIALIVLGCVMMLPVPVWLLRRYRREHGHFQQRPPA